ncbi:MAG: hypothetical protein DWQ31_17250 [Planctomycetota bacterium]|nr:MAG: hypothetical protein DWQ31_17250 [Planctomycetota bacterium]REJ92100.1 MAG: hypothetical protein DWQ35_13200 [Planctomycetota bacterium]REK28636.1 MAG: hypothetical protein DWQ42_04790 [Planctomycetota bacterium]REK39250.1 MAG: hypothetical protein DWQ46_18370 [Planctomycetota bacterium]
MNVCSHFSSRLPLTCVAIAICHLTLLGCDASNSAPHSVQQEQMRGHEVPVVSGAELQMLVQQSDELVLVEFGVNFGCSRCDDMRPQIARLAGEFEGQAKVLRVDYNANRGLAAQLGANICPSYVLFRRGEVVVTRSYPTSADLLAADLDAATTRNHEHSTPTVNGN